MIMEPMIKEAIFSLLVLSAAGLAQAPPKLVDAHVHRNGKVEFLNEMVARLDKQQGSAFLLVKPEHLDQVTKFMATHPGKFVGFGDVSPDDPRALDRID